MKLPPHILWEKVLRKTTRILSVLKICAEVLEVEREKNNIIMKTMKLEFNLLFFLLLLCSLATRESSSSAHALCVPFFTHSRPWLIPYLLRPKKKMCSNKRYRNNFWVPQLIWRPLFTFYFFPSLHVVLLCSYTHNMSMLDISGVCCLLGSSGLFSSFYSELIKVSFQSCVKIILTLESCERREK